MLKLFGNQINERERSLVGVVLCAALLLNMNDYGLLPAQWLCRGLAERGVWTFRRQYGGGHFVDNTVIETSFIAETSSESLKKRDTGNRE